MLTGCDAANVNGDTTFAAALPAADFLIHKASEGATFVDVKYAARIAAARAAGKLTGAYHFGRPGTDWTSQAEHFLACAKPQPGDLLAHDLEVTDSLADPHLRRAALSGQAVGFDRLVHRMFFDASRLTASDWSAIAAGACTFADVVKAAVGVDNVFYSFPAFIGPLLANASPAARARLLAMPLWIADPNHAVGRPVSVGWPTWLLQQFGTRAGLDADVLNGDAATWRAHAVGGFPPAPDPEDDMSFVILKNTAGNDQWLSNGLQRRHIVDVPSLTSWQKVCTTVPVTPAELASIEDVTPASSVSTLAAELEQLETADRATLAASTPAS